jgi:hypothetical protein
MMSRTERGQYRFTVREGDRDRVFLVAEPAGAELKGLAAMLGFDLAPGTTIEQAHELAAAMNATIVAVTLW